ncbi:MAG: hypothetical protein LBH41_01300 [Rickettsiales bacterium]|nr:hypothetical protein [Rickettsiales bacterium]
MRHAYSAVFAVMVFSSAAKAAYYQCLACPKDHYCPSASAAPIACPDDKITEAPGATEISSCKDRQPVCADAKIQAAVQENDPWETPMLLTATCASLPKDVWFDAGRYENSGHLVKDKWTEIASQSEVSALNNQTLSRNTSGGSLFMVGMYCPDAPTSPGATLAEKTHIHYIYITSTTDSIPFSYYKNKFSSSYNATGRVCINNICMTCNGKMHGSSNDLAVYRLNL